MPMVYWMSKNSQNPSAWRQWIPALIWLGVIVLESTDLFSSRNTAVLLYSLITTLFGQVDPAQVKTINAVLRKVGHMVGYGVLSFLLFRAWRATMRPGTQTWDFLCAAVAFLTAAATASLDEWHQTFIASRNGTLRDVFLDSAAALGVQFLIFGLLWKRGRSAKKHRERILTSRVPSASSDPDTRLARKGAGKEAQLSYSGNLLVENRNGLIVNTAVFEANGAAERDAALVMLEQIPGGKSG
jgi:VanZ family protein